MLPTDALLIWLRWDDVLCKDLTPLCDVSLESLCIIRVIFTFVFCGIDVGAQVEKQVAVEVYV